MNDDDRLDDRLRRCLEPEPHVIDRVRARALSADGSHRRVRSLVAIVAFGLVVVGLAFVVSWRAAHDRTETLTASYDEDVIIVRAPDGRCWILGPPGKEAATSDTLQFRIQGGRR
jgi:hypothetical protein